MKKAILLIGVLVCSATFYSQIVASPETHRTFNEAVFLWTGTVFDFGKIKHNVPVSNKFTFRNNGDSPLVITSVQASCGCTVAEYSKDPIPPGGEGFVKATYNAASLGVFNKTITVNANTPEGTVQLSIKGVVVE